MRADGPMPGDDRRVALDDLAALASHQALLRRTRTHEGWEGHLHGEVFGRDTQELVPRVQRRVTVASAPMVRPAPMSGA
jgi:hypothetical protein